MKTLFTLFVLASISIAQVDFCQQHKDTLFDLLDQIDGHLKAGRLISACNEMDRATYFNKRLMVECHSEIAHQTDRQLYYMNKHYCKDVK